MRNILYSYDTRGVSNHALAVGLVTLNFHLFLALNGGSTLAVMTNVVQPMAAGSSLKDACRVTASISDMNVMEIGMVSNVSFEK